MALLSRWDPFAEIARLQDQMSRWAGEEGGGGLARGFTPAVDVYEDKDAFFLKVELPGMKPDDVNINVENEVLTIHGERKLEKEDKREGYHRIERSYGTFTRSFSLPKTVDGNALDAEMKDGMLTVRLPKKTAPEPKRIQVRSGGETPQKPGKPS